MTIPEIILQELRAFREETNERHTLLDERVRKVENWQSDANGKITMVGLIGVFLGGIITWVTGFLKP